MAESDEDYNPNSNDNDLINIDPSTNDNNSIDSVEINAED
jgi:hypothetical protein